MDISDIKRDVGLDVARGVAVLLMFVAQTAPGDGPFKVLLLSEYVPPPLLALLIGMTAQAAWTAGARWSIYLVWGGALIGIGLLLSLVPSQIIGVLVHLGALAVLTGVLVRLASWMLFAAAVVLLVVEPWLKHTAFDWYLQHLMSLRESWGGRRRLDLVDLLAAGPFYRLTALTIYACAGILLMRLVKGPRLHARVAGAAFVGAAVCYLVDKLGGPQLDPYTGTHQVLLFNLFTAVAICEAARLLMARRVALAEPLADIGTMWLTMYILMVLGTAAYLQLAPRGSRDDHWSVLAALIVGSLVLATGWVRVFGGTRFEEGPLEGLLDLLGRRDRPSAPVVAASGQSLRSRT